jgi:hypothetical protein
LRGLEFGVEGLGLGFGVEGLGVSGLGFFGFWVSGFLRRSFRV